MNCVVIEAINMLVNEGVQSAGLAQRQLPGRRRVRTTNSWSASAVRVRCL